MDALDVLGWDDGWARAFAEAIDPGSDAAASPGRVVRHDNTHLLVATAEGVDQLLMRVDGPVAVGDWVAVRDDLVVAVLPRRSVLRRRDADKGTEQLMAANVDVVGVVCGLDRPVKDGRIQRAAMLAEDADADTLVILTKADLVTDPASVKAEVMAATPGVDVVLVSVPDGRGLDEVAARLAGHTAVLVGESGAGKSTLTNALMGEDVAITGEVRTGDRKGRHTTTSREMYVLPAGGVIVDSPGIRSVGVWGDAASVAASFTDIAALAENCRFADCRHATEPGCAVIAAVEAGELPGARLEAWRSLAAEARAGEEAAEIAARRGTRGRPRSR